MKRFLQILILLVLLPSCTLQAQTKRPKVALVLGGGGAKGAAHVGVLKAIEKSGVPVDYVVGTSIGSIVGGLYSCGYRSNALEQLFRSQEWNDLLMDRSSEESKKILTTKDGVTYFMGFPISHKKKQTGKHAGFLRGDSITSFLGRLTKRPNPINFDRLPIPFRCVAVDYNHFQEIVLKNGSLPLAMRASMAIPLAFQPVQIDTLNLMDGGLLNNLPVDVALDMGATYIIAVDLTQNKHEDETEDDGFGFDFETAGSRLLTLLKWAKDRPDLTKYHQNVEKATIYINPDLDGYNAAQFNTQKIAEMIEIGEQAGQEALPALIELRKKITGK